MDERDSNIIKNSTTILEELLSQSERFNGHTLDEIVKTIHSQGIKSETIIKNIYLLEKNKQLTLINPYYPHNFFKYLLSTFSLPFWGQLLFIIFFYFINYYFEPIYPIIFIKYISSFIFILCLPGYALLNALYYKKKEIGRIEKISLIIMTSVAITAITGLIFNYLPWGIDPYLYFFTMSTLSIVFSIYGLYKKYEYFSLLEVG